ncbi:MAG: NAD(P)H:quinone oxidoreductase, partial [Methylobacteriaceae bacterium]|nr:NAD(P)H:quinone oxidoreductase [Methylobacteriaceae bacterium]
MTKILVLYYSSRGHVEQMAEAVAAGVREAGAEAVVKRVPETVPEEVAKKMGFKLDQKAPIATVAELPEYDGIVFGTPTRFNIVSAQMKSFIDQTAGLWVKQALANKVASVFTSSSTQHGGQESTILSLHPVFLAHGMVIVGLPYAFPGLHTDSEMAGGSPFGAST